MFESMLDAAPPGEEVGQIPAAQCAPSGWTSLELDYGTADPARLSDSELIDTIVGFERAASWASARQAILLAEFARRRPDLEPPPGRSDVPARHSGYAPDEVALALRLSRSSAANRLTMAQVLGADLPATLDAWEQGSIDSAKARAIAEASYRLPPQRRAALEARVLPRAGEQTLARLRAALARAVLALDPDGAHARYQHCYQQRRVVVTPEEDGMAGLWALLSAPDATAVHRRLGDLARDLGADDPRGMDARRADLLVDLLTGRRSAAAQLDDPAPAGTRRPHTSRPGKPLISVITPITMLLGLDEQPAELVGYGPIPAPLARQIAAEGTWRRLLTDPVSGALLDYGRTTYTPPAGLADFVRARDVYCRNPICGQPAATADLDHTVPWPQGTTSAGNLHARCRHDHLVKTFGPGWQVDQHPDATITWTTPTGHRYTSRPYDYGLHRPRTAGHDPPDDEPPF